MTGVTEAFSGSYAEARGKFLQAAAAAGLKPDSHVHPELGRDGEELAMDVVFDGSRDASSLLILTSACHGVEGYCGSGVQVFALRDAEWRARAKAEGVAVLYVHALNPYGFSHIRRTTHENVDLNRNFHDFTQPLPVNEAYRELQPLLLPEAWPPTEANTAATGRYIQERGMDAYQAAITRGQHEFPEGLFFGGTAPTWSNRTLRRVLQTHARQAQRVAWIDIHTGLGPSGVGERICACRDDAAALARARAWWGGDGTTPVTSIYDGSSSSAFLTGLMWTSIYDECPDAEYTGIAMEYGTLPPFEMMQALRAEHWLNIQRDAPPVLAAQIKQQMLDAFYVNTDAWKEQIISQARQSLFQAVDGLNS
ncbi:M14 family metallopeptidase [Polaromonas sp.]|uniref:M14 family metallopeptidase n=1 Tax=Polaromonas sp. TaxID=1869339 RepID=UPI003265A909